MFNSFLFKKDLKTLSICFLTIISLAAFAGGDATPSPPHPPSLPPSPLNQDPCEDLSFLAELNWPNAETNEWPFNPLKKVRNMMFEKTLKVLITFIMLGTKEEPMANIPSIIGNELKNQQLMFNPINALFLL